MPLCALGYPRRYHGTIDEAEADVRLAAKKKEGYYLMRMEKTDSGAGRLLLCIRAKKGHKEVRWTRQTGCIAIRVCVCRRIVRAYLGTFVSCCHTVRGVQPLSHQLPYPNPDSLPLPHPIPFPPALYPAFYQNTIRIRHVTGGSGCFSHWLRGARQL